MQIATMTLKKADASSIALVPVLKDGLAATYRVDTTDAVNRRESCILSMRKPKPGQNNKVTLRVIQPYVVTDANGLETVRQVTAVVDLIIPEDAPVSVAADGLSLASTALADSQVTDTVTKGAFPY